MNLTPFSISLNNGLQIEGEYEGEIESKQAIIFVHGFGVERNARGLFTQLGDALKDDYLVVRFDLNKVLPTETSIKVYSLKTQAKILNEVVQHVRNKFKVETLKVIAHSQGSLVIGTLSPDDISQCVLISPPVESPYLEMKEYFSKRKGTKIDEKGNSLIQRADDSLTVVSKGYWQDVEKIKPVKLMAKLAKKTDLYLIKALNDEVIKNDDHTAIVKNKEITYLELPGDHNFSGGYRQSLLNRIVKIIK